MQKTTDYERFKRLPGNRNIDKCAVRKLVASISQKNLLEFRPILVNKNMEVIDGQHRIEAAKELGVPVFYQVEDSLSESDILLVNANQKSWGKEDYLNFFINDGKMEYIKLKRFMEKHLISMKQASAFLRQRSGAGEQDSSFKSGTYKFPDPESVIAAEQSISQVKEIIAYLNEKLFINKSFLNSVSVIRAITTLMNYSGFSFETFMKKLPYRLELIRPCARTQDYLDIFKTMYNWKNQNPVGLGNAYQKEDGS